MPRQLSNSPSVSRRNFLRRSAVAASVAGAVGLSIGRGAHAAGSDTIRIGMIGAGGRCSGAAAQALKAGPDVKLVAMCDVFEERLSAARKNLIKLYPEQVAVDDDHCFLGFDGYQKVIGPPTRARRSSGTRPTTPTCSTAPRPRSPTSRSIRQPFPTPPATTRSQNRA